MLESVLHGVPDMAVREFIDEAGTRWLVWATHPTADAVAPPGYERGWLTFEANDETKPLRRLAPVPIGWEHCSPTELAVLCRAATEATRRRDRQSRDASRPTRTA